MIGKDCLQFHDRCHKAVMFVQLTAQPRLETSCYADPNRTMKQGTWQSTIISYLQCKTDTKALQDPQGRPSSHPDTSTQR